MVACGLLIAVGLSLGNYFVIATQVGWWLRWLIYISPFYWSETAAVNNEFSSPQYASPYPGSPPGSPSQGTVIMASFDCEFAGDGCSQVQFDRLSRTPSICCSPFLSGCTVGRHRRPPRLVADRRHPADLRDAKGTPPRCRSPWHPPPACRPTCDDARRHRSGCHLCPIDALNRAKPGSVKRCWRHAARLTHHVRFQRCDLHRASASCEGGWQGSRRQGTAARSDGLL